MKRLASQLCLVLAALAATPAALAGSDILKCVDSGGRVTLTDQPCGGNARAVKLVAASALNSATETATLEVTEPVTVPMAEQREVQVYAAPAAMERQHDWRPRVPRRDRPLARDVATLKAARAQLLLIDSDRHPRPQLATLQ